MMLSLRISSFALPIVAAGSKSLYFSSTSQIWQERKLMKSLSLALSSRPISGGGTSSRQVQQAAAVDDRASSFEGSPSAEYGRDNGEISKEGFGDPVEVDDRGAASRPAPSHGNNKKLWRGFPGQKYGDPVVTVPAEALTRGAVFKGTVSAIQGFGAFVDIGAFAQGLIHISKMGAGFVKDVNDVVSVGQEVTVSIVNVEQATGRIALSLVPTGERDQRKPYVPPRREEGRKSGDWPSLQSESSRRLSVPNVGKEETVVPESHLSTIRSTVYKQRKERPRYQAGSVGISQAMPEEQERVLRILQASAEEMEKLRSEGGLSGNQLGDSSSFVSMKKEDEEGLGRVLSLPNVSSGTQRDARRQMEARGAGEGPRFVPGSGSRSPFGIGEEEKDAENLSASSRSGKIGEEGGAFASPMQRETREEDRNLSNPIADSRRLEAGLKEGVVSRNSFAPSSQNGVGEEDRMSRNSSAEPRNRLAGEEVRGPQVQQEEDLGQFLSRIRATRFGDGAKGEEKKTKPRQNLVQIGNQRNVEGKMEDNRVSSSMHTGMRSLYECDCC